MWTLHSSWSAQSPPTSPDIFIASAVHLCNPLTIIPVHVDLTLNNIILSVNWWFRVQVSYEPVSFSLQLSEFTISWGRMNLSDSVRVRTVVSASPSASSTFSESEWAWLSGIFLVSLNTNELKCVWSWVWTNLAEFNFLQVWIQVCQIESDFGESEGPQS